MLRPIVVAAVAAATVLAMRVAAFDAVSLADYSGAELFERFCASCHGASGRGDGPVAAGLRTAVPDLTAIARRYGEFPAARIRETIDGRGLIDAHGSREMPVWGYEFWMEEGADVIAEREMRDVITRLVEHIRSLQSDPI